MKKSLSLVIAMILIIGAITFLNLQKSTPQPAANVHNVTMENGKQIIEIGVKGGYSPQQSVARPGVPTVLRFTTNGTFDCSSSVRIPSMNISKNLPQTGTTDIDVGTPRLGSLKGVCGMGMYRFDVNFQS